MDKTPLIHLPKYPGGPCSRCGLRYSAKTAYVGCFLPGDTFEDWFKRLPQDIRDTVERQPSEAKT